MFLKPLTTHITLFLSIVSSSKSKTTPKSDINYLNNPYSIHGERTLLVEPKHFSSLQPIGVPRASTPGTLKTTTPSSPS